MSFGALNDFLGAAGLLPWFSPLLGRWRKPWPYVLVLCLTALSGIWLAHRTIVGDEMLHYTFARPHPDPPGPHAYDFDTADILDGVAEAPRLRDTGRWWTGIWAGISPFWRPLSSYFFWAEWHLFGRHYALWALTSVLLAVLLAALTLWALEPMLGTGGACHVVLVLFVRLVVPWPPTLPMASVVTFWKNQPDLLTGLAILAAVGYAVRGRLWPAMLCSVAAACFKELGFVAFVLAPACLAWVRLSRREPVPWLFAALLNAPPALALGAWHYHAVGFGLRIGSNQNWYVRASNFYLGLTGMELMSWSWWAPALAALFLLCIAYLWRRPVLCLLSMIAAAAVVCTILSRQRGDPWLVSLGVILDEPVWIGQHTAWLVLAGLAWSRRRPLVLLGLPWMLIGAAPSWAAAQASEHTLWLGCMGQAILSAAAAAAAWEALEAYGRRLPRLGRRGRTAAVKDDVLP